MAQSSPNGSVADHLLDGNAQEIRAQFETKHEELRKATELFQNTLATISERGWQTHAVLWNVSIFLNLAAHDISVLVEDLALERNDWRRRLAARTLATNVYETTEDMQELLGTKFKNALSNLNVWDEFQSQYRSARAPLDAFWKAHQSTYKKVRVTAAAHRDQDALKMLEVIQTIDIDDSLTLGMQLGRILNDLGAFLQSVITRTSSIRPPELSGHANSQLEAITNALGAIGENLASQTQLMLSRKQTIERINAEGEAEVNRLLRLPDPAVAAGVAMARINESMVRVNTQCSQGVETILPQLDGAVGTIEREAPNVGSYINPDLPTDKEAAIELREVMSAASKEAAITIQKFLQGTRDLTESSGLSREVNASIKQLRITLEATLECLKRFERASGALVASIDHVL